MHFRLYLLAAMGIFGSFLTPNTLVGRRSFIPAISALGYSTFRATDEIEQFQAVAAQ
jgi:hypothetical protein